MFNHTHRTSSTPSHSTSTTISHPSPPTHHHPPLSALLNDLFIHMFAPASCQQATCSLTHHPASPHEQFAHFNWQQDSKRGTRIIVDDEIVVIDEEEVEEDGGPLCREGLIEGWKEVQSRKEVRGRRRRLSFRGWVGV